MKTIKQIIESYKIEGDFTLASGQKSTYYYDIKNLLLSAQDNWRIFLAICDKLTYRKIEFRSIGGVETGAIPLIACISVLYSTQGFYLRKRFKKHGMQNMIEGRVKSPVLLVEDVVTTGQSLLKLINMLLQEPMEVSAVFAVVDRSDGTFATKLKELGIRFISLYKHD